MAQVFRIPVKKLVAQQRLQVELSGRTFVLDLTWIEREGKWMLDMYDSAFTPLIRGKMMANEANAFQDNYWDERIPRGALGLASEIPGTVPTYQNLGSAVRLYYFEF